MHDGDIAWFASVLAREWGSAALLRAGMKAEEFGRTKAKSREQDWRAVLKAIAALDGAAGAHNASVQRPAAGTPTKR